MLSCSSQLNIGPRGRRPKPRIPILGMAVETPLELKGLLVRVALAGSVSKGILAAQAVAMARSLLTKAHSVALQPARAHVCVHILGRGQPQIFISIRNGRRNFLALFGRENSDTE